MSSNIRLTQSAAPSSSPPAGTAYLFLDSGGGVNVMQPSGAIQQITDGAGNLYVGANCRLVPITQGSKIQVSADGITWTDTGTEFTT